MTEEKQQPRASWAVRGILPFMLGGYLLGLAIGTACGNGAVGMSLGMGEGSVSGLVVGLVFHPQEFRRRDRSPSDKPQQPT
ncbi:MAG: hypothetical protein H6838_01785 [Planctomycetes bacterium]|nr:hypothetical protein [Planctomycetota bacterium]